VAPADTTFNHIYRAAMPYVVINCVVMGLLMALPRLTPAILGFFGLA